MSCEEYEQKINALVDNELNSSDMELIQAHLQECKYCQNVLQATIALKKRLSTHMPRVNAPLSLKARIRQDLEKKNAPKWNLLKIFSSNPIPAFTLAAIILIMIGFGVGRITAIPTNNMDFSSLQLNELTQVVTLEGKLVCINCALHESLGNPVFCKEHNHTLGIRLADGSIWSILENEKVKGLCNCYDHLNKTITVQGIVFPKAKYIELTSFKLI